MRGRGRGGGVCYLLLHGASLVHSPRVVPPLSPPDKQTFPLLPQHPTPPGCTSQPRAPTREECGPSLLGPVLASRALAGERRCVNNTLAGVQAAGGGRNRGAVPSLHPMRPFCSWAINSVLRKNRGSPSSAKMLGHPKEVTVPLWAAWCQVWG